MNSLGWKFLYSKLDFIEILNYINKEEDIGLILLSKKGEEFMIVMIFKEVRVLLSIFVICFSLASESAKGGYDVFEDTINLNRLENNQFIIQGEVNELCFMVKSHYVFSGMRNENIYTVFMLTPEVHISGSVGYEGVNNPTDVIKVKKILGDINLYSGSMDSSINKEFVNSIKRFQELTSGSNPDGKVDVDGATIKRLKVEAADRFFVKRIKKIGDDSAYTHPRSKECVRFYGPQKLINYEIQYNEYPLIVDFSVGINVTEGIDNTTAVNVLNAADERLIKRHLLKNATAMRSLGLARVIPNTEQMEYPYTVYLNINDKHAVKSFIQGGSSTVPLEFSWFTVPSADEVEFRYRMFPEQQQWSEWGNISEKEYYYINIGLHLFQVESRYKMRMRFGKTCQLLITVSCWKKPLFPSRQLLQKQV